MDKNTLASQQTGMNARILVSPLPVVDREFHSYHDCFVSLCLVICLLFADLPISGHES